MGTQRGIAQGRSALQVLPRQNVSWWLTSCAFLLALSIYIAAPIAAITWSRRPFPGFVVEQTVVVSDYEGHGWGASPGGLSYPQLVTDINRQRARPLDRFRAVIAGLAPGDEIVVETQLPDGTSATHTLVTMARFPNQDLARLFWLPFGVGLIYLFLGLWVHVAQGGSATGQSFAVFSLATSLVLGLFFDLFTTHLGTFLWTIGIAMEGGTVLGLAVQFVRPPAGEGLARWPEIVPYLMSGVLATWGVLALLNRSNPWAYVTPWRFSYAYAALGIVSMVVAMVLVAADSGEVSENSNIRRQQARVILVGCLFGFVPVAIWFGASAFGVQWPFAASILLPPLLVFPASVTVAILRYRLWNIDVVINRALVYAAVTAILGGVYIGVTLAVSLLLQRQIGSPPPVAVASATLAIAALFQPLRQRVQAFIDRRFYRGKYDAARTLSAFAATLRGEIDLPHLAERLTGSIQEALQPTQVCLWLWTPSGYQIVAVDGVSERTSTPCAAADTLIRSTDALVGYLRTTPGPVASEAIDVESQALYSLSSLGTRLIVPLVSQGELTGWLGLGARRSNQPFTADDRGLLRDLASRAGSAVRVAQLVAEHQQEAIEQDRIQHEMAFAHVVQQTLLPKTIPSPPGWEIAVYWEPARAVGGDFYDVYELAQGRLAIAVADVADKGTPAALIMASTRPILRGAARRGRPPAEALARANELLLSELPPGMFVTCLYALLDPSNGNLHYANAGHNPPYLGRRSGAIELWATGMALGMMPGMRYDEHEATIEPGDTVLLYSDGLLEAHNGDREMFGLARIGSAIEAHAASNGSAQALIDSLLQQFRGFTNERSTPEDDVTMVALRRLRTGEAPGG